MCEITSRGHPITVSYPTLARELAVHKETPPSPHPHGTEGTKSNSSIHACVFYLVTIYIYFMSRLSIYAEIVYMLVCLCY